MMRRMTATINISHVVSKWDNLHGRRIHSLTDSERRLLRVIKDMGVL